MANYNDNMKKCVNSDCCQQMAHSMQLKACKDCGRAIKGFNCSLCEDCSKKTNRCGHCQNRLR